MAHFAVFGPGRRPFLCTCGMPTRSPTRTWGDFVDEWSALNQAARGHLHDKFGLCNGGEQDVGRQHLVGNEMRVAPLLNRVLLLAFVAAAIFIFLAHVQLMRWADILYHDDPVIFHRLLENRPNYYLSINPFLFYRETLYAFMGRYSGFALPKTLILIQAAVTSLAFYFAMRRAFGFSKVTAAIAALATWVLPTQAQVFFGVNTSYIVFDMLFVGVAFVLVDQCFRAQKPVAPLFLYALALTAFAFSNSLSFAYMPLAFLYFICQRPSDLVRKWRRLALFVGLTVAAAAYTYVASAPVRHIRGGTLATSLPDPSHFWEFTAAMFGYLSPYAGEAVNQWGAHYVLGSWISAIIVALALFFSIVNNRGEIARVAKRSQVRGFGTALMGRDFRAMVACLLGMVFFCWLYLNGGAGPQARYAFALSFFFCPMLAYALVSLLHLGLRPLAPARYRHAVIGVVAVVLLCLGMANKDAHARQIHGPEVFLYAGVAGHITPQDLSSYDGILLHSKWVFVQHSGMPYIMYAKLWYAASRRYGDDVVIPPYVYIDSDNTCQAIFRGPTEAEIDASPWQQQQLGLVRDRRYLLLGSRIDLQQIYPFRYIANSDVSTSTFEVLDVSQTPTQVMVSATTQDALIAAVTEAGIDPATIANMPEQGMICIPPLR